MGLFGDIAAGFADAWNAKQQIEDRGYDIAMQREAWNREDDAVQRRVTDLKKAGLSPTLAAGSAAGTSAPIQASVPKFDAANIMRSVEINSAKKAMALTDAQIDLNNMQYENVARDVASKDIMRPKEMIAKDRENELAKLNVEATAHNIQMAKNAKIPYTTGALDQLAESNMMANIIGGDNGWARGLAKTVDLFSRFFGGR